MSIKTKILTPYLILTSLWLVLYLVFFQQIISPAVDQGTINHLIETNTLKADEFNTILNEKKQNIITITNDSEINDWSYEISEKYNEQTAKKIINKIQKFWPDFSDIFLLDIKGTVMMSSIPDDLGKIRKNNNYFLYADQNVYISGFEYFPSLDDTKFIIAAPLQTESITYGIFVGIIDTTKISEFLQKKSGLFNTEKTYLTNNIGTILTQPDETKEKIINKTFNDNVIDDCFKYNKGNKIYNDYYNNQVFGYYNKIESLNICLLTEVDQNEKSTITNNLRNSTLISSLIFILATIIMIAYIFSLLLKPLKNLQTGVEKFSEGNLKYNIKIKSKDEIGELAQTFNKMRKDISKANKKLEKYSKTLEKEVDIRTSELQAKIKELEKVNNLITNRELKMIELKKQIQECKNKK